MGHQGIQNGAQGAHMGPQGAQKGAQEAPAKSTFPGPKNVDLAGAHVGLQGGQNCAQSTQRQSNGSQKVAQDVKMTPTLKQLITFY